MTAKEKVAHLKGVIEGMEYDTTTKEGKIISLIVDVLGDISEDLSDVQDDVDTLYDFADELDEDLGAVEESVYDEYDEDDDDCDDDECECECGCCEDEVSDYVQRAPDSEL